MLGLRVPDDMEGRVLHEAFENPLPVRYGGRPVIEADPRFDALLSPPDSEAKARERPIDRPEQGAACGEMSTEGSPIS